MCLIPRKARRKMSMRWATRPKPWFRIYISNYLNWTFTGINLIFDGCERRINIKLGYHISLIFSRYNYYTDRKEYGFLFYFNTLTLMYGKKRRCINLPWTLKWVRTSVLLKDGTWEHETKKTNKSFSTSDYWQDKIWFEKHQYVYFPENRKNIQIREAKIQVYEREWRPYWFTWTSLFAKKYKTIEVEFNEEIGEKVGSYKGGCVGCSYEMKENETPFETLKRMGNERTF